MSMVEQASAGFMVAANRLPIFYSLGAEWNKLLDLFEDEQQDQDAILAELERLAGDIRQKAQGIATVYVSLKRMAEMQAAEAKRLANKAKASEASAERLREYAQSVMASMGEQRIETGVFTLVRRLNNPSVVIEDAGAIPGSFNRTEVITKPDKVAILDYVKQTREIPPGVSIVRTERLDIK